MKHEAGLECTIRKEGVGDREAWGRWWLEELEKEQGQGTRCGEEEEQGREKVVRCCAHAARAKS